MKLSLLALPAALALSAPAAAQWQDLGNSLTTADRVSIGTTVAGAMLTVFDFGFQPGLFDPSNAAIEAHQFSSAPALWASTGPGHPAIIAEANDVGIEGVAYEGTGIRGLSLSGESLSAIGVEGITQSPNGFSGKFYGGRFFVDVDHWVGINREVQVDPGDVLAIDVRTEGVGGMTINTKSEDGRPSYGYATADWTSARHYYEPRSRQWRLDLNGVRLVVSGSNGFVGIGTATPQYPLHVQGDAGKPGGGSWSNASDVRLKKNVEPIDGALDRLLEIRGVTYEYIDPAAIHELDGVRNGVVAQEVEAVFPDWVDEGVDGYKRVTFRGFEGVAIEALRELREENDALRRRLDDLERAVAELRGT